MIIYDSECLRRPFFGFYTFTDNLSRALARNAKEESLEMGFYTPKDFMGYLGDDANYLPFHKWHKFYMPIPSEVELWHCSRQKSKYIPSGTKVLMTVHDLNYLYSKDPSKHARYRFQYQRSINKADRLVAISNYAKKDILEHLDVKGKTVDVVYNGKPFPTKPEAPKYIPQRPFLFYVGNITSKKNIHVLPTILRGNDFELVIAGLVTSKSYLEKILAEAKRWGVQDRVKIVGTISEAEKYWYLHNCTAFCFASLSEGFALPIIEAMSLGKPVFVSDHTCIPEIVQDKGFYFNHEFDPDAMVSEFIKGMDDFNNGIITPEMIKSNADRFDWDLSAKQYLSIYKEMLSK